MHTDLVVQTDARGRRYCHGVNYTYPGNESTGRMLNWQFGYKQETVLVTFRSR
jgi:hypothetical protein